MRVYEDPQHAEWAINQLRDRLSGRDFNEVHASDFSRCLRKTYLDRDPATNKPHTRQSIVMFATGFAIQEYFLGEEPPGKEVPDNKGRPLIFSRDGFNEEAKCVYEFKTTGMRMNEFTADSLLKKTEWLERTKAYCHVFDVRTAVFLIYFLFQRDFKSYTVVYTDAELKQGMTEAKRRGTMLWDAFEKRQLPDANTRVSDEDCLYCPHIAEHCPQQAKVVRQLRNKWSPGGSVRGRRRK